MSDTGVHRRVARAVRLKLGGALIALAVVCAYRAGYDQGHASAGLGSARTTTDPTPEQIAALSPTPDEFALLSEIRATVQDRFYWPERAGARTLVYGAADLLEQS